MSITVDSSVDRRIPNPFIEWDTVRGRGDFDAGYINEFALCKNENGEIDEQKRKQFEEDRQHRLMRNQKTSSSSHKRSGQRLSNLKAIQSDDQIAKKARKTRVVRLSSQKQQSKISQIKSQNDMTDMNNFSDKK